jgi:hypothetical protein
METADGTKVPGAACVENGDSDGDGRLYKKFPAWAHAVKTGLQMFIGVFTVVQLVIHNGSQLWHWKIQGLSDDLLRGIGVGLAAAAAVELAYTMFTPGPDEALDPVMLGVAATILLLVGELTAPDLSKAVGLLVLGLLLAVLFATRLMLADTGQPRVWWVKHLRERWRASGPQA